MGVCIREGVYVREGGREGGVCECVRQGVGVCVRQGVYVRVSVCVSEGVGVRVREGCMCYGVHGVCVMLCMR